MKGLLISRIIFTLPLFGALFYVWTQPVSIKSWYEKYFPKASYSNAKAPELSSVYLERLKKESDPKPSVSLDQKQTELLIKIRAEKNVSTLALDIPILGKIVNILDNNSVADALTRSKMVVGYNSDLSVNNVELLINDIKPAVELEYKIIFIPLSKNMSVEGTDRYQISYTWYFSGNVFSKEKWFSLQTGESVDRPQTHIRGFRKVNIFGSPEELQKKLKKIYEEGLPKREME